MLRVIVGVLLCVPVLAKADARSMTIEESRHLLNRTGFGAAPQEVASLVGLSYPEAVAGLLGGVDPHPVLPMPAWTQDWIYPANQIWVLGQRQTDLFYSNRWQDLEQLAGWWIAEMTITPSPLTEKLVLTWSDLFANSFDQHENPHWVAQQNQFLRAHAAGNFADLARGMLRDPAMLTYLNNVSNAPEAPNENLAREFMELFTLGEGRGYTQNDVRAAARMLTGLTVAEDGSPRTVFLPQRHDAGSKTIFGQTGTFDADDLVRLTLQQPDFGPYIIETLWRRFVSDRPDPAEVSRLNQLWHDNNLEIAPLLQAMFTSEAFWDPSNRGRLVKPPIELLVGTVRTLGIAVSDTRDLRWQAQQMGQALFLPPNVGGWPKGIDWINDATAANRATALMGILDGVGAAEPAPETMMAPQVVVPQQAIEFGPNDLRIGQVFATYLERRAQPKDGFGGAFVLYDVSIGGKTWRSLPFWFEYNEADDWMTLSFYTDDCAPDCLTGLAAEENGTLTFQPKQDFMAEHPDLPALDLALLRAVGPNLPALIEATLAQQPFKEQGDGQSNNPAVFMAAARVFAKASQAALGSGAGRIVFQQSAPNVLGLGVSDVAQMPADLDAYLAKVSDSLKIAVQPAVVYSNARAWLDQLPGTGPETARAAELLLAIPRSAEGLRDELVAGDPDALLRSLILSPLYQLN